LRDKKAPLGEHLALLAVKHNLDSAKFFQMLVLTKEKQKTSCGDLSIECRGKKGAGRVFLIRKDSHIVAQLMVPEEFLSSGGNPLMRFMDTEKVHRYLAKKSEAQPRTISDLRVGMCHVNLNAKVLAIPEPSPVYTRFGNNAVVATAIIGDESGTIKLCLWNSQINCISVGDNVEIKNARAFAFKGEKQLRVGTNGVLRARQERAINT